MIVMVSRIRDDVLRVLSLGFTGFVAGVAGVVVLVISLSLVYLFSIYPL